jgi:competence protein ComEC
MDIPLFLHWYYRRPCFWMALAAFAAALAAVNGRVSPLAWPTLLAVGAVALVIAGKRADARAGGVLLAVVGLVGGRAASVAAPPADPALREGAAVTLRGVVTQFQPFAEGGGLGVLRAGRRLTEGGWMPLEAPLGFTLPAPLAAEPGDVAEVSGLLRRPPPATNPGASSPRLEWLRRGVYYTVHIHAGYTPQGHRPGTPWDEWARATRARVLATNRRTLSPRAAVIANDFILGDEAPPDPALSAEVERAFRDSGTIHLLVVSGTQVTLVLAPLLWLGWRFYRFRLLLWGAACGILLAYTLLAGAGAPVARAMVMGLVVVLGLAARREPDLENSLGLAALVLLLLNPLTAFDLGFQLSCVALWALVRLGPVLAEALGPAAGSTPNEEPVARRAARAGAAALGGAVAAHLAVAPLLALSMQRSAWISILANVPMLMAATWMTYLAALHALLGQVHVTWLAPLVDGQARALYGWASFFAAPPLGAGDVFPPPPWLVPVLLAGIAVPSWLPRTRPWTLASVAVLAAALLVSERLPAPPPAVPTVRALDVGQGDALLLQGTDGGTVLVDAGPTPLDAGRSTVARALRALRVARLDAVVVSHGHADHVGGLPEVLRAFPPRLLIENVHSADAAEWGRVRQTVEALRIPVARPVAGSRIQFGRSTLTVLGPVRSFAAKRPDPNAESLVMRWDSGTARVLLTGDVGEPGEADLLRWGPELHAAVLKVAHHGSRTSSGAAWLRAVGARVGVISCGRDNRFGHPTVETLARLRDAGLSVAETDRDGMVTIRFQDRRLGVERYAR